MSQVRSDAPSSPQGENLYAEQCTHALEIINSIPACLSCLYDLNMMPEQLRRGSTEWDRMMVIAFHFEAALASLACTASEIEPLSLQTDDRCNVEQCDWAHARWKEAEQRAEKAERELSAATERLNAPVPEVEGQLAAIREKHKYGITSVYELEETADLARDLSRRLATVESNFHAQQQTIANYQREMNTLNSRAEAAESALAEDVAKEPTHPLPTRYVTEAGKGPSLNCWNAKCSTCGSTRGGGPLDFDGLAIGQYQRRSTDPKNRAAAIRGSSEGGGNG